MPQVRQLHYLRVKKGLTRSQLGEMVNKSYDTIVSWENGRRPIKDDEIDGLCKILDISTRFNPIELIEISNDEYTKLRQYFRKGPAERVSPSIVFFLGKHYPIKSLSEVAETIRNKKKSIQHS